MRPADCFGARLGEAKVQDFAFGDQVPDGTGNIFDGHALNSKLQIDGSHLLDESKPLNNNSLALSWESLSNEDAFPNFGSEREGCSIWSVLAMWGA